MKIAVVCNRQQDFKQWLDNNLKNGTIQKKDIKNYKCVCDKINAYGWIPDKIIELWGLLFYHNAEIIHIFNRYKIIPTEYQDW